MKPLFPDYRSMMEKYTDAVIGNSKIADEPRHEQHIKFKVRSRYLGKNTTSHDSWSIQIWLLPNQYTRAKVPRIVDGVDFSILYHGDSYNLYKRYIVDRLRGIFSQ